MSDTSNFILNLSVLFRNTQKYFDKMLAPYDIGSGQLTFLLIINENEGITMQDVTRISEVDKGTTTKSIQRLIEQGYVSAVQDEKDHRMKHLHTTDKASAMMTAVYDFRNQCRGALASGVDFDQFEEMLNVACENSRHILTSESTAFHTLKIGALQKTTITDYPGKVAATIYTAGCNMKCPFCNQKDLVFIPEKYRYIAPEEILAYLNQRSGLLDGVVISGGEPLLQEELIPFIRQIKELGYAVKLDTNGTNNEKLGILLEEGLLDFVSLDMKNSADKYPLTCGLKSDVEYKHPITESVGLLQEYKVEHEFKTTVVKEFHTVEDLIKIAKFIGSDAHYVLQQFVSSDTVIQPDLHAYTAEEMEEMKKAVEPYVKAVELRLAKEV